jgi:hypothetical protein
MMRSHLRIAATVVAVGGCYAPDVIDCTVTCSAPTDCAGDQVCTADGFCAADGVSCKGNGATVDAALPSTFTLRVQIDGVGKVVVANVGQCSDQQNNGACTWQVPNGPVRLQAVRTDDKPFDRWTTMTCAGQQATCMFTMSASTTVGAKFR